MDGRRAKEARIIAHRFGAGLLCNKDEVGIKGDCEIKMGSVAACYHSVNMTIMESMHLTVNVNCREINYVVKLCIKCINPGGRDLHLSNNCTVISRLLKANQSKLYQLDLYLPSNSTSVSQNK